MATAAVRTVRLPSLERIPALGQATWLGLDLGQTAPLKIH
jgi:hypothetical protein